VEAGSDELKRMLQAKEEAKGLPAYASSEIRAERSSSRLLQNRPHLRGLASVSPEDMDQAPPLPCTTFDRQIRSSRIRWVCRGERRGRAVSAGSERLEGGVWSVADS